MNLSTFVLLLFCLPIGHLTGQQLHIPSHSAEYNFQIIQPHEVASNYQILKLTDEVLRRNHITYWAWGGTLIGAVRHRGFIPWDFDTDICVYEEDRDQFLTCAADLQQYDAYILPCNENARGQTVAYRIKRIKGGQEIYGHVDVFLMQKEDDRIVYSPAYHQHFFLHSELAVFTRLAFGPIHIDAPSSYMPYLIRGYGKDVMTMAEIMYTLDPATGQKYCKFEITDFKPAIYEVIDHAIPLDETALFPIVK